MRSELLRGRAPFVVLMLAAGGFAWTTASAASAGDMAPSAQRYVAPIEIAASAPFVALPMPPSVYAKAMQAELRDLRVVDAQGERVPFAWLSTLHPVEPLDEHEHEAALYPMPPRPADGKPWPAPVEVSVVGDRITVRRSGEMSFPEPPRESPGWLIDLGETKPGQPLPGRVRLRWAGPAEFTAAYQLETSDDLRTWRAAGSGQLMALQSSAGVLAQPWLALPNPCGRFLRLAWLESASAPALLGATVYVPTLDHVAAEPTNALVFQPLPELPAQGDRSRPRSLDFDLGGELPVVSLELRFATGTRVAPVRLQGRSRADAPWRDIASGVFYRLERDGTVAESPAIAVSDHVRYVRVVPDERAAALAPGEASLVVQARLATLVFATTGPAPYRLLAGSVDAPAGALPLSTLVPRLDDERARFGRATLGAFTEEAGVARAADDAARQARWRPWLLWSVLVVGVAGLGALVWRLARGDAMPKPPTA